MRRPRALGDKVTTNCPGTNNKGAKNVAEYSKKNCLGATAVVNTLKNILSTNEDVVRDHEKGPGSSHDPADTPTANTLRFNAAGSIVP